VESPLTKKINDRLITPFNSMTTFFLRRSVEKAFQLDEQPSDLSLNPHKPLNAEPPHITSAVDDIMYIVNKVLQQSVATSQIPVVMNVIPTLSRVLGSDFIGMIQRKMRDEHYPKGPVQGTQPPEQTVIAFLVLINNLDVAVDYIRRIIQGHVERMDSQQQSNTSEVTSEQRNGLVTVFPFSNEGAVVTQALQSLSSSFESKVNDLLADGVQVVYNNVVKHRLRPILADAFRDIEYQPRDDSDPTSTYQNYDAGNEDDDDASRAELVRPRFASAWKELILPISRILTPGSFDRLLGLTVGYLARLLEKRLWSYHGRINALGTTRLDRDVSGIISSVIDVGGGHGVPGWYRHRDTFTRCAQIVLVMGMEDDEWEDAIQHEAGSVVDKLTVEEQKRARAMVQ
jgi:conserved oligomeric Golgi complex subunit 4